MKNLKTVTRSNSGFTLLEILVAVAILSTSLVAILSAHNKALLMNSEAVTITEVVGLAREEMEKIYMRSSLEDGLSDLLRRSDYPQYQWRTEIRVTPFKGSREVIVTVFRAGKEEAGDLFTLKAYVRK